MNYAQADLSILTAAAQLGDERASDELLNRLEPVIRRHSKHWHRSLARHGHELDDLVQEARIAAIAAIRSWRADGGAGIETYADRLVQRRLGNIDRAAKAARRGGGRVPLSLSQPVGEDEDGSPILLGDVLVTSVTDPAEIAVTNLWWRQRSVQLDPDEKRLARLLQHGYTLREIAEQMGSSVDATRGLRDRLRAKLASQEEEED